MAATMMSRTFEDRPAVREQTPLLVGLVGPSGSGKTMSALRIATGIQKVAGGEIYYIDSEARRALHYADMFHFRHLPFAAPFGPLDYLAAIEHCVRKGARTIVVDSQSHEHEGPGGVLEMHAAEVDRMCRGDQSKADRYNMLAWQRPKSERRRLLNSLLQMEVNFIFCFRAKEKIKVVAGKQPIQLGWMPIAGEEFIYEMTVNCLLYPASGGVPTWHPDEVGEKMMIKLPGQFRDIFAKAEPLSEDIGEKLARWAAGERATPTPAERFARALPEFAAYGVDPARIFAALQVDGVSAIEPHHLESLRGGLKALKAGKQTPEALFPPLPEQASQEPPDAIAPENASQAAPDDEDGEPWDQEPGSEG